jgi:hypothetical protein
MAFIGANTSSNFNSTDTFTSDYLKTDTHDLITGSIISSAAGSFYVDQSPDGVNWGISTAGTPLASGAITNYTASTNTNAAISIAADVAKAFSEQIILPFWRIRFVRGSGTGTPTRFNIHARTSDSGVKY